MTPKITAEQRQALELNVGPVPVEDEQTHRIYFLVDASRLREFERQQDLTAVAEGVADMQAGRVTPIAEAFERIRANLNLPQTQ